MCGIFGIVSKKKENLNSTILDGLYQLQNRGYDSAGFCYIRDGSRSPLDISANCFIVQKYASTPQLGALEKLRSASCTQPAEHPAYFIGFGHNRWATHGMKTDTNAHPHLSNKKLFSVVHNGIIENYQELKHFLLTQNYVFYSQTDTEIIVNLVEHFYLLEVDGGQEHKIETAIEKAIHMLHGTYGLIIQCVYDPNVVYCIRNGSPILVGYNDDYAVITSEINGFCNLVSNYFILHNNDLCKISVCLGRYNDADFDADVYAVGQSIEIKTISKSQYSLLKLERQEYLNSPYPYPHWTLREIYEQPDVVRRALNHGGRIKNEMEVKLGGLDAHAGMLKTVKNIILLGCGTSFFSCCYGAYFLKSVCAFHSVQVFDGADFNEKIDLPHYHTSTEASDTAFVLVSQSGETRDLYRCIEIAKNNNIPTIGIVNAVNSLISREVDCGIYCNAGKEIAVASTKAFTSQVICLSLLSLWFSQLQQCNNTTLKRKNMIQDLHTLSNDIKQTLERSEEFVRNFIGNGGEYNENCHLWWHKNMFVLGKGCDEYISKEGALKIKEISYIHAEGYSASSLKHGPFALLDENFPCILLNTDAQHTAKIMNCYEEINARGSPIIVITNDTAFCIKYKNEKNRVCLIPENKTYSSLLAIIPLQLLAYYLSVSRNINPDQPKNLAKVVTVE